MCAHNEPQIEPSTTETASPIPHVCGYCGSTSPLIPYEEMYGPGAHGWPCCPDCGGI